MFHREPIEQFLVRDEQRNVQTFEDFTLGAKNAFHQAGVDKMIIFTMPDGSEFTILRRPIAKVLTR